MSNPVAKKPRAPRAKKQQPTKEEILKQLQEKIDLVKQIRIELQEDEAKIAGLSLKRVPELISETWPQLDEDEKEVQEKYDELLAVPSE